MWRGPVERHNKLQSQISKYNNPPEPGIPSKPLADKETDFLKPSSQQTQDSELELFASNPGTVGAPCRTLPQ